MSNEIIIANPIYDVVFKRLMDDTENARFFIETLLDQEVENLEFKPQEYPIPTDIVSQLPSLQLPRAMTFFRLDFLATIKTATGDYQKVLIEVQKGKKSLNIMRFRGYLAEHYKRVDEIAVPSIGLQKIPLHIITIYILGFELKHIPTPAVKIAREYIDLMTKEPIITKDDFAEQLTHDCIIIQTSRIHGSIKTELDALLSLFEQNYFMDQYGHFKKYIQPLDNQNVRRMAETLSYVASSDEDRRLMETEESIRQIVDGDFNEEMQKVRYELKKRSEKNKQLTAEKKKAIAEKKQIIAEKEQVITEKEQVITEKEQVIAEKDKQIAELLAQLTSK
ncbi:MAG: hypothetical protein LBC20_05870 [Planctomycetaceae bacterium]|jgi:hypothetical protein|nr:hypothetical protein [Planctomycetaceae bacterium]